MHKRNLFMLATILCGLLAVAIEFSHNTLIWFWHDNKPVGAILLLLAAIFGSQWLGYERRYHATRPGKSGWLRRVLYTGVILGCAGQSRAQCFENRSLFIDDALGYTVSSLALGDFNGDGKADIAAAHYNANAVAVVMGDGAYNFAGVKGVSINLFDKKSSYAVGYNPRALAVGFFNNDFKLDLVVANNGNHTISVLINKGNGDFYPAVSYAAGLSPTAIAVSDINLDGNFDVLVTNVDIPGGAVSILLGKGNGKFNPATHIKTGGLDPEAILVADVNNDSKPDLATCDFIDGTLTVRFGNGSGGFGGPYVYTVGKRPNSMAARDLNGDGKLDIVVSLNGENKVAILYNGPGGLFYPPVKYDVGYLPNSVCLGDIDNDGKTDIVVANHNSKDISILLNKGGYFLATDPTQVGQYTYPSVMVMGYLNSDKQLDLAIGYSGSNTVDLRFQSCSPNFPTAIARSAARQAADNQLTNLNSVAEFSLQATVAPNPVEDLLQVRIDGAGDGPVRLWLTDLQGRTVADQTVHLTDDQHQATLPMGQNEGGMYLLRVSTATENKTLKVLKR